MSSEDALSLADSGSEFSGFDSEDLRAPPTPKMCRKNKAVVGTSGVDKKKNNTNVDTSINCPGEKPGMSLDPGSKPGKVSDKGKTKKAPKVKSVVQKPDKQKPLLDLGNLCEADLSKLKIALGLTKDTNEEGDYYAQPLRDLPNIHVSLDRDDLPEGEVQLDYDDFENYENYDNCNVNSQSCKIGGDFRAALFDEEPASQEKSDVWQLPKLKAPDKGPAVSSNLANLINTACTLPCDTDEIVAKYKLPENCSSLGAPLVNHEIWKIMDKRARSQDRGLADIQNLLSVGMMPVLKLADVMKSQGQDNIEARTLLTDVMTIIGQAQYQMSLRRRYMIRPNLNRKYSNLCNVNTPVSSYLFGDDIGKEIKSCDTGMYLGREAQRFRGRGFSNRPFRSRGAYNDRVQRFVPYPQRGQYRGQYSRPFSRGRRIPATVTSEASKN